MLLLFMTLLGKVYILGQMLTPDSKSRVLGKAVAYGDDAQGGLVCCDSWGRTELNMTEVI